MKKGQGELLFQLKYATRDVWGPLKFFTEHWRSLSCVSLDEKRRSTFRSVIDATSES
jgi:hypothetical protein